MRISTKILLIFFFLSSGMIHSQNVGQYGDSLINYTDINGMKQGYWKKAYPNGNTAYEGFFLNDKPVGTFKRYHENGKLSTVLQCEKDTFRCRAELFSVNQKLTAKGNYYQQKRDSIWNFYSESQRLIAVESYKEGMRHGEFITFYENGNRAEVIQYKMDKEDGVWRRYYPGGQVKLETLYRNGLRNGPFYVYYESVRDKAWIFYLEDLPESKTLEVKYEKGKAMNQDELDQKEMDQFKEFERNKGKIEEPEKSIRNRFFEGN
jgi:antitoxin component YwqK of YwqJK toxin-antitoxin module